MGMQMHHNDWVNAKEKIKKRARKIGIFSDRDSFFFKEKIGIYLDTKWTSLYDLGPSRIDQKKDIFKMAHKLSEAVSSDKLEFGFVLLNENYEAIDVICNRYKNVRAIFAVNDEYIINARKKFDANILIIKNNNVTIDTKGCEREINLFLETKFEEDNLPVLNSIDRFRGAAIKIT